MDGYDATAALRGMGCRTAIVAVTANAMAEQVEGACRPRCGCGGGVGLTRAGFMSRGASAVLTKPLRLELIVPILCSLKLVAV